MKIYEVSLEDGKQLAYLMKALKIGKWNLDSDGAELLTGVRKWVHGIVLQVADQIKLLPGVIDAEKEQKEKEEAAAGMRIKSIKRAPVPMKNHNAPKQQQKKNSKKSK